MIYKKLHKYYCLYKLNLFLYDIYIYFDKKCIFLKYYWSILPNFCLHTRCGKTETRFVCMRICKKPCGICWTRTTSACWRRCSAPWSSVFRRRRSGFGIGWTPFRSTPTRPCGSGAGPWRTWRTWSIDLAPLEGIVENECVASREIGRASCRERV